MTKSFFGFILSIELSVFFKKPKREGTTVNINIKILTTEIEAYNPKECNAGIELIVRPIKPHKVVSLKIYNNLRTNDRFIAYETTDFLPKHSADSKEQWLDPSSSELIINHIQWNLSMYLPGNQIEIVNHRPVSHLHNSFWSDWKVKQSSAGDTYFSIIYPTILQVVSKIARLSCRGKGFKILELCSGDGQLARMLFADCGDQLTKYFGFELNEPSITQAHETLKHEISIGRALLCRADITTDKFDRSEEVDFIVGSGALTLAVLPSKESAQSALIKSAEKLKAGGFVVLSGLEGHFI